MSTILLECEWLYNFNLLLEAATGIDVPVLIWYCTFNKSHTTYAMLLLFQHPGAEYNKFFEECALGER